MKIRLSDFRAFHAELIRSDLFYSTRCTFYLQSDTSSGERTVRGVRMTDGSVITADRILSGCSPYHTFIELMENRCDFIELDPTNDAEIENKSCDTVKESQIGEMANNGLPPDFVHHIKHTDFSCGAFKINCAVNNLPNFTCYPSPEGGEVGPMHRGNIVARYVTIQH